MWKISSILLLGLLVAACNPNLTVSKLGTPPKSVLQDCKLPSKLPDKALTQAEVEKYWGRDRVNLRACQRRFTAIRDWYIQRDRELNNR